MDVHLTKDNKIVVNHDPTLGRTYDKDYVIKYNKLSELKDAKQKLNKSFKRKYPTLSDFDKALPDDFTFLIETKVETNKAIKALSKVVNSMKRNVMVMSFYPIALINMDYSMPNNINGLLVSLDGENMELQSILKVVNKYRLIIHPYYQKKNTELEEELKRRMIGYSPWGISEKQIENALIEGHDMINSNYVHLLSHLPKRLITKKSIKYRMNDQRQIKVFNEKGEKLSFQTHILFDNPLGLNIKDGVIEGAERQVQHIFMSHMKQK